MFTRFGSDLSVFSRLRGRVGGGAFGAGGVAFTGGGPGSLRGTWWDFGLFLMFFVDVLCEIDNSITCLDKMVSLRVYKYRI